MKVAILGPVTTDEYYGGVAVFDEELALGFKNNKWDVVLLTNQKVTVENKKGIPIRRVGVISARKVIEEEKPDIILASLNYAKYWRNCDKRIRKIYFLHGFFNRSYYGKIKAELGALYQKNVANKSDYVFSNSYFTQMINNQFFDINSDCVFHLGVTAEYLNELEKENIDKKSNTILYVGRLVSAKGVGNLMSAMKILKNHKVNYELYIAGDGPDEIKLKFLAQKYKLNVHFLGRITQRELALYYRKAEVFVSLNPSEPFGIVFPEALIANCKILCPYTGGQIEYLKDYGSKIEYVNEKSEISIAEGIEKLLSQENDANELTIRESYKFNYNNVASKIIEYLEENSKDYDI